MASETQDRMLSEIEDLGYTTNRAARSLRSRAHNPRVLPGAELPYRFAVEARQGVNRAPDQATFYPLVSTTHDVRQSECPHTNPHNGRREARPVVAAKHAVGAGCRTSDDRYRYGRGVNNPLSVT